MKQIFFLINFIFCYNCISFVSLKPNLEEINLEKININNKESILLSIDHDIEVNGKKSKSSSKDNEYLVEFFVKILKESNWFSSVEKGLVKTDKKLIINIKQKIKVNLLFYYLSIATFTIIPFYADRDFELIYNFKEKKDKIIEFKREVQVQNWIQLFLLPASIFTAITNKDNKHFELMTKSVLEEAFNESVFK